MVDDATANELRRLARMYETAAFYEGDPGDPSRFMHQVEGDANREAAAFLAASLSFGSRAQFMPKIQSLVDAAGGDVHDWIVRGGFAAALGKCRNECFYRFYTRADMVEFLSVYRDLIRAHGTLGAYVRERAGGTGLGAVRAICQAFACAKPVPSDATSACKRVCMFLRWMVRSGSPVDIGLWSSFVDRRTLVMPLDVHVVSESVRLGLLRSKCASMGAAIRLTGALAEVFPDDPLKGDFALFGYGVNHKAGVAAP